MRRATSRPDEADPGPHQLAVEQEVRAPPPLRLDLRGRRQHHHETEHEEHGDDDGDHVEADRRRPSRARPRSAPARVRTAPEDGVAGRRSVDTCRRCNASWRRSRSGRRGARATHPLRRQYVIDCTPAFTSSDVVAAPHGGSRRHAPRTRRRVPVEAGAARRQQDDVAGEGSCPGDVDSFGHRRCRHDRHAGGGERRGDVVRSPRRWRRRRGSAPASAAIGARSRPLLRPPAMRTTWSKPSIAAAAACGVVAFESLNQATPSASATSSMRCGGPTNEAERGGDRRGVGQARSRAPGRRRRGRWSRRGAGCGASRPPAAISPRGDTSSPSSTR